MHSIRILSAKTNHHGTLVAFNISPNLVWMWVPGSSRLSKTHKGRNLFFPAQYDLDAIVSGLERLPQRDPNDLVDLQSEPVPLTLSTLFKRKSYLQKGGPPAIPLKLEARGPLRALVEVPAIKSR